MRFGADSEEVYDEMIERAIEETVVPEEPRLLIFKVVGWPLIALGVAIGGIGILIVKTGAWIAGVKGL